MKKNGMFRVAALCFCCALLLCSCGKEEKSFTKVEPDESVVVLEKGNAVEMSFYAINLSVSADGSSSGISSSGLDASVRMVKEYIAILKSTRILSKVQEMVGSEDPGVAVSVSDLRKMISMESVDETALIRVRFTSENYTKEELLQIANVFMSVVPGEITHIMLGLGNLSPVDAPYVVE